MSLVLAIRSFFPYRYRCWRYQQPPQGQSRKVVIMEFEFIDESDIEAVRRGRKSTVPQELVEAFRSMPKGKAIRVTNLALDPKSEDYKNDKASVSAILRSAGKQAGVEVTISWSPLGVPQVATKAPKVKVAKK